MDTFKLAVGATIQTQAQDGGGSALSHVAASLSVDLSADADGPKIDGFGLSGGFEVFGLQVATDGGNVLSVEYDFTDAQFEASGGVTVTIPTATPSTVDVVLGYANDPGAPGIVIKDGVLTQLNAEVTASLTLAARKLTTPSGLNFSYNRDGGQFEMYGSLVAAVPTAGGKTTAISAVPGTAAAPGLVIQGGELEQLALTLGGQFDLFGLTIEVSDATLTYSRAADEYTLSGTVSAPQLKNATVSLGTTGHPGITMQDGEFQLDGVKIGLSDVNLGVFTIQQLTVAYTKPASGDGFDLDVKVYLLFPGGWGVFGEVGFDEDEINNITLAFSAGAGEGIEIGDTGLSLTYIEASVRNIAEPHNLVVSGDIGFAYGPTFTLAGQSVTLFAVVGGFTVDRKSLRLDAAAYLGAYYTGSGPNLEPQYASLIGGGSGSMTLDWADRRYELAASLSWYGGALVVEGVLAFDGTGDIVLGAKASLEVPKSVPLIGGKTLGSADFLFVYHSSDRDGSFVAAWTDFTIPVIDKPIAVGVKYDLGGGLSIVGGSQVKKFEDCLSNPDACLDPDGNFVYFNGFQAPPGATAAALGVSWPIDTGTQTVSVTLADGTVVHEKDFAANNIRAVPGLSSATTRTVTIVSSGPDAPLPPGGYRLTLTSGTQFDHDQVVFGDAVFHIPGRRPAAVGATDPSRRHTTRTFSGPRPPASGVPPARRPTASTPGPGTSAAPAWEPHPPFPRRPCRTAPPPRFRPSPRPYRPPADRSCPPAGSTFRAWAVLRRRSWFQSGGT